MSPISQPLQSQSQSLSISQKTVAEQTGSGLGETDAASRAPILLLYLSSALWLMLGSLFTLIATLKFHNPNILADCAWFTYGRVYPAANNAFIYGFGMQAGLGTILWLLGHLGRVRLQFSPVIIVGALIWNTAVTLGLGGILYGENSGFESLEMPLYATTMLFFGYLLIGLGAFATFHHRVHRSVSVTHWFIITALFWFAWIFTTACLLLTVAPLRGALQSVLAWWYVHNLVNIWFGFVGIGSLFYFIPKITDRPLHNHQLTLLIFWTLIIFGSWGGIPVGTPVPSWLSALSTMSAMLTIIPVIAVSLNIFHTASDGGKIQVDRTSYSFLLFGTIAFVLAGLLAGFSSVGHVTKIVGFTWFIPAQARLALYGFFAMTMFGAIYYILPRLLRTAFPAPKLLGLHFIFSVLGVLFYVVPLMIGGIEQGKALNNASIPFANVTTAALKFLRVSTLGDGFILLGNFLFLFNLFGILFRIGKTKALELWTVNTRVLEVKS